MLGVIRNQMRHFSISDFELRDDGEIIATKNNVRVILTHIGEGYSGDYNPDDPEDEPLYRFDVFVYQYGEWELVPDASYCTGLSINAPLTQKVEAAKRLLFWFWKAITFIPDTSVKRLGEQLSWIGCQDDVFIDKAVLAWFKNFRKPKLALAPLTK